MKRVPMRPFLGWIRVDAFGNCFGFVEPMKECCNVQRGERIVRVEVHEVVKPKRRRKPR